MAKSRFVLQGNEAYLKQSFSEEFAKVISDIPEEILRIEAVDPESLDIPHRFDAYHDNSVKITGEENANVGKSIHPSHRIGKVYEGFEKIVSYQMLHSMMVEMYGVERANEAIRELLMGTLGMNDSANVDLPYCVAYSSSFLMREGRSYIKDVPNVAPTNYKSYINMVSESMFDASAEFMGACVVFDLLIGMAYYTKRERDERHQLFKSLDLETYDVMRICASHMTSSKRTLNEAIQILRENCNTVEEMIDYSLNYEITNALQGWIHLMGNKFRKGHQSIFTNLNLFSPRVLKDNFEYYEYPNGEGIDKYLDEIITLQLLFANFFSKGIKGSNDTTRVVAMPVVTLMVPNDSEGAEELQEIDDKFIDTILALFSRYNNINIYRGLKLAMCCRLTVERNNSVAVNSLGVKTQSDGNNAVGSLRVITADLASVALEAKLNGKDFFELLDYKLDLAVDILNAQREIIYRRDKEGLYKLSQAGWVDLTKLASTFGGVGIYECLKILTDSEYGTPYSQEELDLGNKILSLFNQKCIDMSEKYGVTFNMEVSIPAESMAFRFAERARIKYGTEFVPYTELSNQFTPLTFDFGIHKKLEWENILSSVVSPTGICHINTKGHLTPEQNIRLHRKMWELYPHVEHYAFNDTIFTCSNNHVEPDATSDDKCIICGAEIVDKTTRSIGYFKSVYNDFGPKRADEYKRRKWFRTKKVDEALSN